MCVASLKGFVGLLSNQSAGILQIDCTPAQSKIVLNVGMH
jgi:hypothetical protein